MNCIIVDDDEFSRKAIKHLVLQVEFLNLVAVCSGSLEAVNVLSKEKVDLIFLDIVMPEISGIDFLKNLNKPPPVILITSKKEHALEAFEYNVVDYLLKPLRPESFIRAVTKAHEIYEKPHSGSDYVFIKNKTTLLKVKISDILWIEAFGDYTNIYTNDKKYILHSTMKTLESKLSSGSFIRVHRSYIVSLPAINSIDNHVIVIGDKLIPIGAIYHENLLKRLNLL